MTVYKDMDGMMMPPMLEVSVQGLVVRTIKYLIEGLAVALAAYMIPRKKSKPWDIAAIAMTAAAVFAVLDVLAPEIAHSARQGAGFAIGATQVGFKGLGVPGN